MFVEHKEKGEVTEAPAKTLKLSEAIRDGAMKIREDPLSYLNGRPCGCAIAMAGVAYGLDPRKRYGIQELFDYVGKHSGLPEMFLRDEVEGRHVHGTRALEIADWLESQGN